jgi:regulator of RNase E activity RraA
MSRLATLFLLPLLSALSQVSPPSLIGAPPTGVPPPAPELASADVADAVERLTGRRAHMASEIRLVAGSRLSGPAVTLSLVREEGAASAAVGLAVVELLESAPAGSVVVATLDDRQDLAVVGASLGVLAGARRLAGFVVDGAVRDLADLRRLGLPTFARGTAAGSAGGHYRLAGVNQAVTCGGLEVRPGDHLVADEDGVAVAPRERLDEVLALAKTLRDEERSLLPLIEAHGSYREALRRRAAAPPGR